jgi:hypothetical protein
MASGGGGGAVGEVQLSISLLIQSNGFTLFIHPIDSSYLLIIFWMCG